MAGPAGATHRAFFENVGFQDAGHVLCASDWPHTLTMPVSLGEVPSSESCTSHVFWSIDGSVLTVRDRGEFRCAYDYREHEKIEYEPDRIEKLITSRGGLGPEYADYPDSKGEAPAPPLWPWLSGGLLLLLLLLFALRPHRARRRN